MGDLCHVALLTQPMGGVIANPFLTALTGKAAKRSVAAAAAWMVVRREVMICTCLISLKGSKKILTLWKELLTSNF